MTRQKKVMLSARVDERVGEVLHDVSTLTGYPVSSLIIAALTEYLADNKELFIQQAEEHAQELQRQQSTSMENVRAIDVDALHLAADSLR